MSSAKPWTLSGNSSSRWGLGILEIHVFSRILLNILNFPSSSLSLTPCIGYISLWYGEIPDKGKGNLRKQGSFGLDFGPL